ncbi:MAG TPA: hypothetical protein VKQ52_05085, partial [Puia sp.]|nr:hypothetical protein [Puia sp.]
KVDGLTLDEARNMTAGEGEFFEGEPVPVAGGTEQHQEPSAAELLLRSIEEARELRESLFRINTDFAAETAVAGETPPVEAEAPIRDEESPFVLEEAAEPVMETESPVQPVEEMQPEVVQPVEVQPAVAQEPVEQQVAEARPEPVGDAAVLQPEPVTQPVAEPSFVFEPYHTIDYFASQGIKLTLDENPSDPLGKQLKSFTDWLKSMRRLPQKDREVIPDRVLEQTVQNFAAHSIEGKEVVTETMAEVLAKQGMREKARVVYEKLSLLNPDKRAYFATKIEQLNIL